MARRKSKYLFLRTTKTIARDVVTENPEVMQYSEKLQSLSQNQVDPTDPEYQQLQEQKDIFLNWFDPDDYANTPLEEDNTPSTETSSTETPSMEETSDSLVFNISDYNQSTAFIHKTIKNIDSFNKYSLDITNNTIHQRIDFKEARTSIEHKQPFVITKFGKKTKAPEDIDGFYKTVSKMPIQSSMSSVQNQRIGFVLADKMFKEYKLRDPHPSQLSNKHKKKTVFSDKEYQRAEAAFNKQKRLFRGIIDDEYLIFKKKPSNTKKIGYLHLNETDQNQNQSYYVEVVQDRGYKWLFNLFIIILLAASIILGAKWYIDSNPDWHFNKNFLTLYKTAEQIDYINNELQIGFNATPVLTTDPTQTQNQNQPQPLNINIVSSTAETAEANTIFFKPILYINNEIVYESEELLPAGSTIPTIQLNTTLPEGEYEGQLKCRAYKSSVPNNSDLAQYMGDIESSLIITVK